MRGSNALKTGMFKLQQFVDQLKKPAATTPGANAANLPTNPANAPSPQFQAQRNSDGFNGGTNLTARYASMLQGTPLAQTTGSKQTSTTRCRRR